MKVSEILKITASVLNYAPEDVQDLDFVNVVAADLMSEIMLEPRENSVMVTGLINPQIVRTAEMVDIFAIIIVRGKDVREDILELAADRGIVIMSTKLSMYETCGRLYKAGLISINEVQ